MARVGIADTTFSRIDLAKFAIAAIKQNSRHSVVRYTVPGIKDLPVACKKLFVEDKCKMVLALGMVGPKPIDKQCCHEATLGIQAVQLQTNSHIIEVFVHVDESQSPEELIAIAKNRTIKHALNAIALLKGKTELTKYAGAGRRQGKDDEGPLKV